MLTVSGYDEELATGSDPADLLDDALRVTSPRRWLALLALLVMMGAAAAWSWFGTIPSTVQLAGVLLHGTGPVRVTAPVAGTVATLAVSGGGSVSAGGVIATVTVPGRPPASVTSPVDGIVMAVRTAAGRAVPAGAALVDIDPVRAPLRAVLLVPYDQGLPVAPGDGVRMQIAAARSALSAQGAVLRVSPYPVGAGDLSASLAGFDPAILGLGGGAYRVVLVDLRTIGLVGTAARGIDTASATVPSLVKVFADVTVSRRRPLSVLLGQG